MISVDYNWAIPEEGGNNEFSLVDVGRANWSTVLLLKAPCGDGCHTECFCSRIIKVVLKRLLFTSTLFLFIFPYPYLFFLFFFGIFPCHSCLSAKKFKPLPSVLYSLCMLHAGSCCRPSHTRSCSSPHITVLCFWSNATAAFLFSAGLDFYLHHTLYFLTLDIFLTLQCKVGSQKPAVLTLRDENNELKESSAFCSVSLMCTFFFFSLPPLMCHF